MKLFKKMICLFLLFSFSLSGCTAELEKEIRGIFLPQLPDYIQPEHISPEYFSQLSPEYLRCAGEGFISGAAIGIIVKLIRQKGHADLEDLLKAGAISGLAGAVVGCLIVYHLEESNKKLTAKRDSLKDRLDIAKKTNKDLKLYLDKLVSSRNQRLKDLKKLQILEKGTQERIQEANSLKSKIEKDTKNLEDTIVEAKDTLKLLKHRNAENGSSRELEKEISDWKKRIKELENEQTAFASIKTRIDPGRI